MNSLLFALIIASLTKNAWSLPSSTEEECMAQTSDEWTTVNEECEDVQALMDNLTTEATDEDMEAYLDAFCASGCKNAIIAAFEASKTACVDTEEEKQGIDLAIASFDWSCGKLNGEYCAIRINDDIAKLTEIYNQTGAFELTDETEPLICNECTGRYAKFVDQVMASTPQVPAEEEGASEEDDLDVQNIDDEVDEDLDEVHDENVAAEEEDDESTAEIDAEEVAEDAEAAEGDDQDMADEFEEQEQAAQDEEDTEEDDLAALEEEAGNPAISLKASLFKRALRMAKALVKRQEEVTEEIDDPWQEFTAALDSCPQESLVFQSFFIEEQLDEDNAGDEDVDGSSTDETSSAFHGSYGVASSVVAVVLGALLV